MQKWENAGGRGRETKGTKRVVGKAGVRKAGKREQVGGWGGRKKAGGCVPEDERCKNGAGRGMGTGRRKAQKGEQSRDGAWRRNLKKVSMEGDVAGRKKAQKGEAGRGMGREKKGMKRGSRQGDGDREKKGTKRKAGARAGAGRRKLQKEEHPNTVTVTGGGAEIRKA